METILLFLQNRKNIRILSEYLSEDYEILKISESDKALDEHFDLCIIDHFYLKRFWDKAKKRKEAEKSFLPFILLISQKEDIKIITQNLWQIIDDVILCPIDKKILKIRIQALLQTRKISLELEERYRVLVENANEGIVVVQDGMIKFVNPKTLQISGYSKEELISRSLTELIHPDDKKILIKRYLKVTKGKKLPSPTFVRFIHKDKGTRWIEIKTAPIYWKGKLATLNFLTDITERKKEEEKIRKLYSLQETACRINQTLLRIKNERELFQRICNLLVRIKDFKFAWIGFLREGTYSIIPVAKAGFERGYLSSIKIRWDNSEYGKEPTGMAIKMRKTFVVNNIEDDPQYAPWKKEALKREYKSSIALPLVHENKVIGALTIYSGEKDIFDEEKVQFLEGIALDIYIGIKTLRLQHELEKSFRQLEKIIHGIIYALAKVTEARDPYTAGHQRKVAQLACAIAREMGLSKGKLQAIYTAGFIHDIGKIHIPTEILSKPGKLTPIELSLLKLHSRYGYDILKDIKFPWPIAEIVLQHHERMDGSGYPQGLKDDDIILEARILAVADVIEAMSSHRPYRPALGINKALEEIEKNKGILYDPQVVDTCLKLFREKRFKLE